MCFRKSFASKNITSDLDKFCKLYFIIFIYIDSVASTSSVIITQSELDITRNNSLSLKE